jgi:pyruvate kinase
MLSKYRPEPPIFALSPYERIVNRDMILWGTFPILCPHARDTDKLVSIAEEILEKNGFVQPNQVVGIVAGTRTKSGATNFMRLHMIGDRDVPVDKAEKADKKDRKTKKKGKKK